MDIKVDETGSLIILSGQLVLGDNSALRKKKVLEAHKGQLRQAPELGVGINDMIHSDESLRSVARKIVSNLRYDGFNVDVSVSNGNLIIKDLD